MGFYYIFYLFILYIYFYLFIYSSRYYHLNVEYI